MDIVLGELLGSPTKRQAKMQVTNLNPEAHEGGAEAVLRGVVSPLRKAISDVPREGILDQQTADDMIATDSAALALAAGAANTGLHLSQKDFEYLESVNSLSPLFHRAAVSTAYSNQLLDKAREFRFVKASHRMREGVEPVEGERVGAEGAHARHARGQARRDSGIRCVAGAAGAADRPDQARAGSRYNE